MIYSKEELYNMAVCLLKRIPWYDPGKFVIHLEYVTYDMTPSIAVCEGEYHLDMYERGQLISREASAEVEKALYWILEYTISQYAHRTIWERYVNPNTKTLSYTEQIRQEERELKLNSFERIGGVYQDWYRESLQSRLP